MNILIDCIVEKYTLNDDKFNSTTLSEKHCLNCYRLVNNFKNETYPAYMIQWRIPQHSIRMMGKLLAA